MLFNYIRIAWRNFRKHALYSGINIFGLAVGLAVSMLILLYVAHEWSFDRFHTRSARIFDVFVKVSMGSDTVQLPDVSFATGPVVKAEDPRVEDYTRMMAPHDPVVLKDNARPAIKFSEKQFLFADSNFFRFFSFPLVRGSVTHVLDRPFTVVLSENAATRYFGNADPIGKVLRYNDEYNFEVTGVAKNAPSNSTLQHDFVASLSSLRNMQGNDRILQTADVGGGAFKTYLLLRSAADAPAVRGTMQKLHAKANKSRNEQFRLMPFTDVHLNANFDDLSNLRYLNIFPLVAGLILLLALINYMSLATARATLRGKEVGVRKALGAARGSLAKQFYIESSLYALLAFSLAVIIFLLAKPYFLQLLSLRIDSSFIFSPLMLAVVLGLMIFTIFTAGSYPALVLSSFRPVAVLYGKLSRQSGGGIRKVFTVLQFTISIALIISGVVIDRQLYFFRHAETGIQKENILMVPFASSVSAHYQAFKNDVATHAGVQQVATAHYPMFAGYDMFFVKTADTKDNIALPVFSVDSSFIDMLQLKWKYAPVSNHLLTEKGKVAVNESAIRKLGLPENPVGTDLVMPGAKFEIVGVLKDFTYTSLHRKVDALSLFVGKDTASGWSRAGGCLFAKVAPGTNLPSLIRSVRKAYEQYDSETPFEYTFMDDAYDALYKAEDRLAKIFSVFTGLTILIACLGLFGLAAFTAEQRTKEIGVRKVMGAGIGSIVQLLSRDFLKLVFIAMLLASPVAWYLMHQWLQDFAYRIELEWWMVAASCACALLLAWCTVSVQSIRAALLNPVRALRTE